MKRFVEGVDRGQSTLLPEFLDDGIGEDNPVRVIDAFVEALDLAELGFAGVEPKPTGRPSYHPAVLLKLYIYDYLNRVQSSRRLEREAGHNFEVMSLLGRLVPDHKRVADFRRDNGPAIRKVCARFVELCRQMGLLAIASVAVDGSNSAASPRGADRIGGPGSAGEEYCRQVATALGVSSEAEAPRRVSPTRTFSGPFRTFETNVLSRAPPSIRQ
jgi:transposase